MANICQIENSSEAQERGEEGGENRHSKVRTTFFPWLVFFLRQQEGILFFSPSLPRLYKT